MKKNASLFDKLKPGLIIGLCAVFLLGLSAAFSILTGSFFPAALGFVFLVLMLLTLWILGSLDLRVQKKGEERLAAIGESTLRFLIDYADPVAVLSELGEILWANKSFQLACGQSRSLYGKNVNELLQEKLPLRRLQNAGEPDGGDNRELFAHLAGVDYRIRAYRFSEKGKNCLLTVWSSQKELKALEKRLRESNALVAFIAVDNYSDADGILQGNYRTITARISILLKEWATEMDAILREVENDRYILITEERHLAELTEKKFDILDRVRQISTEDSQIPVTVSVGAAISDGTMAQKEATARQALDLALQRGGDQAVLKCRDNSIEYYGGKTKTVQKQTKIRSRVVASELKKLIEESSNVLIMGHRFADHDSIGSCVGIARFAMTFSEKVNIVVNVHDANLKAIFKKLSGLPEYQNLFLDGISAQDLINSGTLLIICDVNNPRQFEAPELYQNVKTTVIIDHHRKAGEFPIEPVVAYIEPNASSASELVSEMLEQQLPPGSLLKEEAELLFAGIILDTKQFANNTGIRTFDAAHFLRGEGANPAEAQMLFRTDLDDFKRELKFEANAFIYRDIVAFSYMEENATQEDKIAASKAADRLLLLQGVLASFVLCRMDNTVYVSARSSGTVNVQLITEKLHGGGHFDMAGAQMKGVGIKEAFVHLKEAVDEYLNEA